MPLERNECMALVVGRGESSSREYSYQHASSLVHHFDTGLDAGEAILTRTHTHIDLHRSTSHRLISVYTRAPAPLWVLQHAVYIYVPSTFTYSVSVQRKGRCARRGTCIIIISLQRHEFLARVDALHGGEVQVGGGVDAEDGAAQGARGVDARHGADPVIRAREAVQAGRAGPRRAGHQGLTLV